jgi:predicted CopG family antitoxin
MTKPIKVRTETYEALKKIQGVSFSDKIDTLLRVYHEYTITQIKPKSTSIPSEDKAW